jgi:hypothetical protein
MSLAAICSNIFGATSAEDIGIGPGLARAAAG